MSAQPVVRVVPYLSGRVAPAVELAHGEDPRDALTRNGFRLVTLRGAALDDGALTIEVDARPGAEPVPQRPVRRDPDVRDDELADARPHRRIAAYAVVLDGDHVLLTRLSDLARTAPGAWTLPGGGLDPGEDPVAGLVREVWEETGQQVTDIVLRDVTTDHWIGRAPDGGLEDFHPVRLVHTATCPHPIEPVVHDIGGTTSEAAWVPVAEVLDPAFPLVRSWSVVLREHLRAR